MEVKIIECPRDAMQGIVKFIPTELKLKYLKALAAVGFHAIDYGSFVSPKAIPQMSDTAEISEVLAGIEVKSKLLAIVANRRGAAEALRHPNVSVLGFPFSVSETFQQRNTNAGMDEALLRVKDINEACKLEGRELVVYISMAFGNPYGNEWNEEIVLSRCKKIAAFGVKTMSLSDTVGVGVPESISKIYKTCQTALPDIEWGMHLHAKPLEWRENIEAAWEAGCRRFDGALKGYGGCPMATDELTGNIATENLIQFFKEKGIAPKLNYEALGRAMAIADEIFAEYAAH